MTFPDPSSLMLHRERRLGTSVCCCAAGGAVCVLRFGALVRAWSSRQVDVSPFAEVRDDGCGGSVGWRVRRRCRCVRV